MYKHQVLGLIASLRLPNIPHMGGCQITLCPDQSQGSKTRYNIGSPPKKPSTAHLFNVACRMFLRHNTAAYSTPAVSRLGEEGRNVTLQRWNFRVFLIVKWCKSPKIEYKMVKYSERTRAAVFDSRLFTDPGLALPCLVYRNIPSSICKDCQVCLYKSSRYTPWGWAEFRAVLCTPRTAEH